jgi:hypothetical protein
LFRATFFCVVALPRSLRYRFLAPPMIPLALMPPPTQPTVISGYFPLPQFARRFPRRSLAPPLPIIISAPAPPSLANAHRPPLETHRGLRRHPPHARHREAVTTRHRGRDEDIVILVPRIPSSSCPVPRGHRKKGNRTPLRAPWPPSCDPCPTSHRPRAASPRSGAASSNVELVSTTMMRTQN